MLLFKITHYCIVYLEWKTKSFNFIPDLACVRFLHVTCRQAERNVHLEDRKVQAVSCHIANWHITIRTPDVKFYMDLKGKHESKLYNYRSYISLNQYPNKYTTLKY